MDRGFEIGAPKYDFTKSLTELVNLNSIRMSDAAIDARLLTRERMRVEKRAELLPQKKIILLAQQTSHASLKCILPKEKRSLTTIK